MEKPRGKRSKTENRQTSAQAKSEEQHDYMFSFFFVSAQTCYTIHKKLETFKYKIGYSIKF